MNPLFALSLAPEHVVIIVLAGLVAVGAISFFFRTDVALIAKRRKLIELNTVLSAHAMPHLGRIAECLAVGDLAGAFSEAEYLLRQMNDPKQAAALIDAMFYAELPNQLADLGGRAQVLKTIGDWAVANPDLVKAAGLLITALPK